MPEETIMETLKHIRSATTVAVMTLVLLVPLGVSAQANEPGPDAQAAQNDQDPPGRVARLNYIDGSVSFQPADERDWVDATLNRPLMTGDNLWTDENSRAELHVGSTAVRLGEKTGMTLLEVSDRAVQIRLAMGSLIVNVRHVDDQDAYEIDTPNVAFVITQPGDYRVDVSPDDYRTDVTVWRGRGDVTGGGSTYTIVANQVASLTGNDRLDHEVSQVADNDALDAWASERDRREADSDSGEYVSSNMTGSEDLGSYGDWSYVAEYGYVWRPAGLAPGWAPYRFGRWVWAGSWGWTWVADEPWGFAPFHYGRWAFAGNGWVWVPGPRVVRPVYAPALVGWIGGGPASNRRVGAVGWFPLAPGEVFIPAYKASGIYVNRINTTNTNVTEARVANFYKAAGSGTSNIVYANRGVQGGITEVSRDTFVNARPVGRNLVEVSAKESTSGLVSQTAVVEPSQLSRLGAGVSAHQPPAVVSSRAVVAVRMPTAAPNASGQGQALVQRSQQSPEAVVRQLTPGQRVSLSPPPANRVLHSDTTATITEQGSSGSVEQTRPRVWEEQGTPEPESAVERRPEVRGASRSAQERGHTAVKSNPPAPARTPSQPRAKEEKPEYSSWHPQRAANGSHSSTQSHSGSSTANTPPKK